MPARRPDGGGPTGLLAAAVPAGVLLPFVVLAGLALSQLHGPWFPVLDQAVLDLRLRDLVAGDELPMVGAFSRYGWNHPGPIWFVVLAPCAAAGGATGILVGSILWVGAGFATFAAMAVRRFGEGIAALLVAASAGVVLGAGWFTLVLPWNPNLAVAWYPVLLLLLCSAVRGRPGDLLPAAFLGGLLVQLHVGYAALVAAPLLTAVAVVWRRCGRGALARAGRAGRMWIAATVVAWLPPLVEQIAAGRDGNLARVAAFAVHPTGTAGPRAGVGFATGALGGAVRSSLRWVLGSESTDPLSGSLTPGGWGATLVLVVALAAAGALAVRRRRADLSGPALVLLAAMLAGWISLAGLVGARWPYLFVWRFTLVWASIALVAATAWTCLGGAARAQAWAHRRDAARGALAAAVLLLGAAVVSTSVDVPDGWLLTGEPPAASLTEQAARSERPAGPVLLVRFGPVDQGVADGVLNGLDRQGWELGVLPELAFKYGDTRSLETGRAAETWLVSEASATSSLALQVPGARVVARTTPLSAAEEDELVDLQVGALAALAHAGRLDEAPSVGSPLVAFALEGIDTGSLDLARLAQLNDVVASSGACRCVIVAAPPGGPTTEASVLRARQPGCDGCGASRVPRP